MANQPNKATGDTLNQINNAGAKAQDTVIDLSKSLETMAQRVNELNGIITDNPLMRERLHTLFVKLHKGSEEAQRLAEQELVGYERLLITKRDIVSKLNRRLILNNLHSESRAKETKEAEAEALSQRAGKMHMELDRTAELLGRAGMNGLLNTSGQELKKGSVVGGLWAQGQLENLEKIAALEENIVELRKDGERGIAAAVEKEKELLPLIRQVQKAMQGGGEEANKGSSKETPEEFAKWRVEQMGRLGHDSYGGQSLLQKGIGFDWVKNLAGKEAMAGHKDGTALTRGEAFASEAARKASDVLGGLGVKLSGFGIALGVLEVMLGEVDKMRALRAKAYVGVMGGMTQKYMTVNDAAEAHSRGMAKTYKDLLWTGKAAKEVGDLAVAATDHMSYTFGRAGGGMEEMKSAVDSFTHAAVAGTAIGWEFSKSIDFTKMLSGSMGQVGDMVTERFKRMIKVAQVAGQGLDDLMNNIGNFGELSTQMGDRAASVFTESIANLTKSFANTQLEKNFAQQAFASAGKSDPIQRMGWALATGQSMGAGFGGRGPSMMAKAFDTQMKTWEKAGEISKRGQGYTDNDRTHIYALVKNIYGDNIGKGLIEREGEKFNTMTDILRSKLDKNWEKEIAGMDDPEKAGLKNLELSTGYLDKLMGMVANMLGIITNISNATILKNYGKDLDTISDYVNEQASSYVPGGYMTKSARETQIS